MIKYIYLYSRGDRLGSHLLQYLSIIIYAHYNNLYIIYDPKKINYNDEYEYEGTKYKSSFFVKAILNYVDQHNAKLSTNNYPKTYDSLRVMEYLLNFEVKFDPNSYFYSCDLLIIGTQVLYSIQSDLISYFRKYLYTKMKHCILKAIPSHYSLPFDPSKVILVHLRMGDVKDRTDYDGSICSNYYKKRIDSDCENIQGIATLGYSNLQTPLAKEKVYTCISQAKQKYPDREVILITSPGNYDIDFPYKCIRSDDENYDLFLLCNSEILILSRSTFALSSAFLGIATEIWCPLWGHFVCTGLYTKYDNSKFNYFF